MLRAIEAIVEKDGTVNLLEPIHPVHPTRAVVTLLEPTAVKPNSTGHVSSVLALLNSPEFKDASPGNPEAMEATIQSNRTAWND